MNIFQYIALVLVFTAIGLALIHYGYSKLSGECLECASERFQHGLHDFTAAASIKAESDEAAEEGYDSESE